jgi:hypothetical protein
MNIARPSSLLKRLGLAGAARHSGPVLIAPVSLLLSACASTGVVPADGGSYLVAKRILRVGYGPPVAVKAVVYREASDFCAEQGMSVETIRLDVTDSGFGQPGSVSLQFRCE